MNGNNSAFSGGTKVTFNTGGTYSSGPRKPTNKKTTFVDKVTKGDSNKKTFLYGFLGALIACIIVFAGFGIFNTVAKKTTLGSTSSITIDNADESENLAEAVANKCLPSVVAINVYTNSNGSMTLSSLGSGVILSDDGYVITNHHVIDGAAQIKVTANGQEYEADKIGEDSSSDIAVIKLKGANGLRAIELADSDKVKVGAWVMSIGSPFGLEQSVATGIVSATSRSQVVSSQTDGSTKVYPNLIQTDAAINPGNSGGALVDKNGRLLGINALIESDSGNYSGVGFAIPVNYAVDLSKQIIDGKKPSHAQLGITMTNVTANNAQQYGWSVKEGAYVSGVTNGGSAERAGIKVGDIITKCEDDKISTTSDLLLSVRKHNPGDTIEITLNRAGEEITVKAVLGSDEGQTQQNQQQQQQQQRNKNKQNTPDIEDLWKYFFGF